MERLSLGWTVSICSVNDPHIVNSNSAGGSNETDVKTWNLDCCAEKK